MSDSDCDKGGSQTESRQRFKNESEENEKDFADEKEIEAVLIDNESCEIISDTIEPIEPTEIVNDDDEVTVCRGIRNLQPLQRPSFISRQFNNVKNFFSEFIEFILLFLTTLFNPMADVNTQVQEHNQRRMAREGRYFSSTNKPRTTSFPGCGPSS